MAAQTVLLVEDSENDRLLARRAFKSGGISAELQTVANGKEALAYLVGSGATPPAPLPDLVLLDLNLPGIPGLSLLKRLRRTDRTALVPVVVLTTSGEEEDVRQSYHLGANSYVKKPIDYHEFAEIVLLLTRYWLGVNETRSS